MPCPHPQKRRGHESPASVELFWRRPASSQKQVLGRSPTPFSSSWAPSSEAHVPPAIRQVAASNSSKVALDLYSQCNPSLWACFYHTVEQDGHILGFQLRELMVKIVMDELVELMGGQAVGINVKGKPGVVLVAGLQGSGKTTFSAKLANHLKGKRQMKHFN